MVGLVPCKLERRILPKVWGGRRLESLLGVTLPPEIDVGETWEIYDRDDGSSPLVGTTRTLRDVMRDSPRALLGSAKPGRGGRFPLLLKFIDARDALSVQIHPNDAQAEAAGEGDAGKTEAWIVLDVGDDGRIIHGLRDGVTREQVAAVAETAEVEGLLRAFRPDVGDAVFVPAGTIHALGPDVVVFEVQQNSDVTYRFYDWGRPRETHVDRALDVLALDSDGPAPSDGGPRLAPTPDDDAPDGVTGEWLVRDDLFSVRRLEIASAATLPTAGSVKILTVTAGFGTLGWRVPGEEPSLPLELRAGDTVLVPACTEAAYVSPIGKLTAFWTSADRGV